MNYYKYKNKSSYLYPYMFDKIPYSVQSRAQVAILCDTRKKTRMKEFRGIIKEGISHWWKSELFVFRATMLNYEHFEVSCRFLSTI
jgi:hypothetical protein